MLSALLGRGRARQENAAEELQRRLGEKASLVVDDRLVAEIGVGRKALYRIIHDMVRRERMYMLADANDQMLLMTNTEFNRFMFRRGGWTGPAAKAARTDGASAGDEDSGIVLEGPAEQVLGDYWEIPAAALDSEISDNVSGEVAMNTKRGGARENRVADRREMERWAERTASAIDLEWFNLDVGLDAGPGAGVRATGTDGPDLPDPRQSLPERKREAWGAFEDTAKK